MNLNCLPPLQVLSRSPLQGGKHTLRSEKFARDVECFTSDNDYFLAVEQLLCDRACETTKQVTLAINDNLPFISIPFLLRLRLDKFWGKHTTGSKVDILPTPVLNTSVEQEKLCADDFEILCGNFEVIHLSCKYPKSERAPRDAQT